MSDSNITSGIITNEIILHRDVELEYFRFQLEYSGSPIEFIVVSGEFPQYLVLESDGLLHGDLREMDEYVPEFEPPEVIETFRDGTHYATFGSAEAYTKEFTFTIRAVNESCEDDGGGVETTLTIIKLNNYSRDRDFFVRQMEEDFGTLDFDGVKRYFTIGGQRVTADEYIAYQKSQGLFHKRG